MKTFYACLDSGMVKEVPQWMQHLAIRHMCEKVGGRVSFYTAEHEETLSSLAVIREKAEECPDLDGIVFFRLRQFCHGARPNFKAMEDLLHRGLELHFTREQLSVRTTTDLATVFPLLHLLGAAETRQRETFWKPVWDWMSSPPAGDRERRRSHQDDFLKDPG